MLQRFSVQSSVPGAEELVLAVAADGIAAAVGDSMSDSLAGQVPDLAGQSTPPIAGESPTVLERCRALLEEAASGQLTLSGGPSYLASPPVQFDAPVAVLRSDSPKDAQRVRGMRPSNWEPGEWDELIDGGEGTPWSMIIKSDQVVSIATPPRRTLAGAEAGTWTAQAFRGRGYAAATTAAWADLMSTECAHLFYSTSADNYSSQHVAERLGLRNIGWLWKLTRTTATS